MTDCLFCKIIAGSIPSKKVYEDEKVFAFEDIKPGAPTHVLIVPKKHIVGIDQATEADAELVGYCQLVAAKIAKERKLEHGFRTVYNVGPDAGQTVFPSAPASAGRKADALAAGIAISKEHRRRFPLMPQIKKS